MLRFYFLLVHIVTILTYWQAINILRRALLPAGWNRPGAHPKRLLQSNYHQPTGSSTGHDFKDNGNFNRAFPQRLGISGISVWQPISFSSTVDFYLVSYRYGYFFFGCRRCWYKWLVSSYLIFVLWGFIQCHLSRPKSKAWNRLFLSVFQILRHILRYFGR